MRTQRSAVRFAQPTRLAAVSVDLDEIGCYRAIHGQPDALVPDDVIYDRALPRFRAFLRAQTIPATFFAVGQDLAREENQFALRDLINDGHEVANHSFHHRYDLSRHPRAAIRDDIGKAQDVIEHATGTRPAGFRAPGYVMSETIFSVLAELKFAWDSSIFPCPSYYGAKALALGLKRLRRSRSASILDSPTVLFAEADPFFVGDAHNAPKGAEHPSLLELPIGVTRTGSLPFIGTALALAGTRGARWLARAMVGRPVVNLEFHGIDLADAEEDDLTALLPLQPDLRRRASEKESAFQQAIGVLRDHGYEFVTLSEAAARTRADALP